MPNGPAVTENSPPRQLLDSFLHHYDALLAQIARRFGDRHFAQDVVQDVGLQLVKRPERDGIQSPLALLRRIAHEHAISCWRHERRRQSRVLSLPELPEVACPLSEQERLAQARQALDRLTQAIEALPERCREVFVMHKIHLVPQAQVAAHLGISIKTVEKHLRLGMARCRAELEKHHDR
ncbi:putative ECF subfamily sigma-70 factor [Pseudomonas sp. BAY1663]|nr:putative ECF subfamily sigma-70 factor [Pseudomonas sp. BAY1663]